jgi:hypothetical protein
MCMSSLEKKSTLLMPFAILTEGFMQVITIHNPSLFFLVSFCFLLFLY